MKTIFFKRGGGGGREAKLFLSMHENFASANYSMNLVVYVASVTAFAVHPLGGKYTNVLNFNAMHHVAVSPHVSIQFSIKKELPRNDRFRDFLYFSTVRFLINNIFSAKHHPSDRMTSGRRASNDLLLYEKPR